MRKQGDNHPASEAPTPRRSADWGRRTPGAPLPDSAVLEPDGGFWVFAYGSLMWNPGFPYAERRAAALPGYRRSFCVWSVHYRGTVERPGLVLALDQDATAETRGVAYRVAPEHAAEARAYVSARELVSAVYFETVAPLILLCDSTGALREERRAVTYVVDPAHEQYAGRLSVPEQTAVIAASVGPSGPNCEYLFNTVAHLREMGLTDADLGDLAAVERAVRMSRET